MNTCLQCAPGENPLSPKALANNYQYYSGVPYLNYSMMGPKLYSKQLIKAPILKARNFTIRQPRRERPDGTCAGSPWESPPPDSASSPAGTPSGRGSILQRGTPPQVPQMTSSTTRPRNSGLRTGLLKGSTFGSFGYGAWLLRACIKIAAQGF